MTILAEGGAKSAPRSRLLWLALALSLTLNIFFIGGLYWSHVASQHPPGYGDRLIEAGADLKLAPEQGVAFKQFATRVQDRTRLLRDSNMPLIRRVWEELAKPQPDQALVGRLTDEATENRHAYQKDMTVALTAFLDVLSPDQRTQFVELAKRRQDPRAALIRRLVAP